MKKLLLTAAAGVALACGAAQAATVTYTFENPGADTPENNSNVQTGGKCNNVGISSQDLCSETASEGFVYGTGDLAVTATAFNGTTVTNIMQDLRPSNSGLAVTTDGETTSDDQVQVERNESIKFSFDVPVFLNAMDFNAGGDTDCNSGSLPEGPCGSFTLTVFDAFDNVVSNDVYAAIDDLDFGSILGAAFQVTAITENAGFAIGSITVSEVPLPGAAIFLLSGLAGLGFARSRKTA